jgi:hypothetical protein
MVDPSGPEFFFTVYKKVKPVLQVCVFGREALSAEKTPRKILLISHIWGSIRFRGEHRQGPPGILSDTPITSGVRYNNQKKPNDSCGVIRPWGVLAVFRVVSIARFNLKLCPCEVAKTPIRHCVSVYGISLCKERSG